MYRGRHPRSRSRPQRRHPSGGNYEDFDDGDRFRNNNFPSRARPRRGQRGRSRSYHENTQIIPEWTETPQFYESQCHQNFVEHPYDHNWGNGQPQTGFINETENYEKSEEDPYSEFLNLIDSLIKPESANFLSKARNGALNKIATEIMGLMERYGDRVSRLQFMNRILTEQESFERGGYRSAHPIKLLMLFVCICREMMDIFHQHPISDVEDLFSYFGHVFNNTLKHVKKNPHKAARLQLNILGDLRLECGEIGLSIEYLDDIDQIPEEAYLPRETSDNQKMDDTFPSLPTEILDQVSPVSTSSPIPHVPVSENEEANFIVDHSSQITAVEPESDEEGFRRFMAESEDCLEIFRRTRNLLNHKRFGSDEAELPRVVKILVNAFLKEQRLGRFRMDRSFFEILFKNTGLNNAARKAVMWTVAEIFSRTETPTNFCKAEADQLQKIIENFNVSKADAKWDTLEILGIRNLFRVHLPPQLVVPIDELIPRLIVLKYRRIKFSNVDLTIEHFYPRNLTVVNFMASVVLEEIPPQMNDFVRICKEMRDEYHCEENKKKAPSPSIICLGPVSKPPPPVVTLE